MFSGAVIGVALRSRAFFLYYVDWRNRGVNEYGKNFFLWFSKLSYAFRVYGVAAGTLLLCSVTIPHKRLRVILGFKRETTECWCLFEGWTAGNKSSDNKVSSFKASADTAGFYKLSRRVPVRQVSFAIGYMWKTLIWQGSYVENSYVDQCVNTNSTSL